MHKAASINTADRAMHTMRTTGALVHSAYQSGIPFPFFPAGGGAGALMHHICILEREVLVGGGDRKSVAES